MPIEGVVNRISDLDPRWPRNADIVREGAAHLRNIKTALKQKENDEARFIRMFWGTVQEIPSGWVVCDGQNGTPDMRNRVPVGAGDQYALGASGGADSVTLSTAQMPVHGHTGSAETGGSHGHSASSGSAGSHSHSASSSTAGEHRHGIQGANYPLESDGNWSFRPIGSGTATMSGYAGAHSHSITVNSGGAHSHSVSIGTGGAHNHTVTVGNTGGGEGHENRMPFRALFFIMKLAS